MENVLTCYRATCQMCSLFCTTSLRIAAKQGCLWQRKRVPEGSQRQVSPDCRALCVMVSRLGECGLSLLVLVHPHSALGDAQPHRCAWAADAGLHTASMSATAAWGL
jgi:hypothetical protein